MRGGGLAPFVQNAPAIDKIATMLHAKSCPNAHGIAKS
jgi:hypothetical protein